MTQKLSDICVFSDGRVAVADLDLDTYISTENMLPNKEGVTRSVGLPVVSQAQAYQVYDVLVSNIRPYFRKIWIADRHGGCSNDVLVLRAKEKCNPKFLYYLLSDDNFFDYATATAKGTKMPRGDKGAIMRYEVPILPLDIQMGIADALSALDALIATNKAINRHLEQMAQAIFKSWFVDFEPWGGVMPDDWVTGTISEIAVEVVCGKTPSTKVSEYFGNNIPFITIPDMYGRVYVTSTERSLSKAGANSQRSKTVPPNSICVSCIATAGLIALTSVPSQTNQQINTIICKDGISPFFIYLTMIRMSDKVKMLGSSGSATNNLNKGQFSKIKLLIPERFIMDEFSTIITPFFKEIKRNQHESSRLATLRDTLLPRLMSGEVSVANIDRSNDL
jgi:type I restriction enzyme S subunit